MLPSLHLLLLLTHVILHGLHWWLYLLSSEADACDRETAAATDSNNVDDHEYIEEETSIDFVYLADTGILFLKIVEVPTRAYVTGMASTENEN